MEGTWQQPNDFGTNVYGIERNVPSLSTDDVDVDARAARDPSSAALQNKLSPSLTQEVRVA
jgi:hypothetical protein